MERNKFYNRYKNITGSNTYKGIKYPKGSKLFWQNAVNRSLPPKAPLINEYLRPKPQKPSPPNIKEYNARKNEKPINNVLMEKY